jgi:D-alanyl-lipoteichoic acid acyltransferase DltB (MBOAT superfamily)
VGSTLDFVVGLALARVTRRAARNALLLASIAYYLGVLAAFKYWAFAADSLTELASALGWRLPPIQLRLILPFGISFFTFETMSYTIDVWRGAIAPTRRYLDYLLFVAFFPHLVAGPIVRPGKMFPQLAAAPRVDAAAQARGLWRVAIGLAKKVAIGDYLAQSLVSRVFGAPDRFTALEVLMAVYAFAMQIYADFSGYSDVAIGSAALFGYELPENFDAPYLAADLREFWRRWHVSLSTWLRDYLYKPLGGSRRGSLRTYANLMITMVLGGLWHGASWSFVLWGALHGGALVVTRAWQRWGAGRRSLAVAGGEGAGWTWISSFLTLQFVCFAWIFFRAPTVAHAVLMLQRMVHGSWTLSHIAPRAVAVVGVAMLLHAAPRRWEIQGCEAFVRTPALVQGLVLAAAAMGIHLVSSAKPEPFVYGQF